MTGLGSFISEKRDKRGLTQLQLARAAGVDPSSLSRWERGRCLPSVEEYRRVLVALGVRPAPGLDAPQVVVRSQRKRAEARLAEKSS